jgi:uncharacterized membrane protein
VHPPDDVATRKQPTRRSGTTRGGALEGSEHALEENIKEIKAWERASVLHRSRVERLSDGITQAAASGPMLVVHVVWFGIWIVGNLDLIPGLSPFDPFPFQLLTMIVSLEAIFLSLFVLASQNRLTHQAEMRANLDLQIDLLAEREMTAVLQLLQDIARHLDVKLSLTSEQIRDLAKKTDIHTLTNRMEEFPENPSPLKSRGDATS